MGNWLRTLSGGADIRSKHVRDAVGIYGAEPYLDLNFYIDNVRVRNAILGTRVVNQRAELLQTDDLISGAALDKYRFIRDGFLQRRRSLVYDGSPPPAADDTRRLRLAVHRQRTQTLRRSWYRRNQSPRPQASRPHIRQNKGR